MFPDPSLQLALNVASKLEEAREESKPIILFLDHSGQLSFILPFRVYGNFLFYEFQGEVYVTYYDAQRTYRLKGLPIVFCVENQLYPIYVFDAAVLNYLRPLRDMLLAAVAAKREQLIKENPSLLEQLEEKKKKKENNEQQEQQEEDPQEGDPDPFSDNPLEQLEAVNVMLQSDDPRDVLTGIKMALAVLGAEFSPPIDVRVITRYVPKKSTLRELITYYERWAYAQFAAMAGLHQFYTKRLEVQKLLRVLLLIGLLLLGLYFVFTYVLPFAGSTAVPPRPPQVTVP